MMRLRLLIVLPLILALLAGCGGNGTPDEDLVLNAIDSLYRCGVNGTFLGDQGTMEAEQLLFLAPGTEGTVYRYGVRITGPYGSNINTIDLYDKDGTWVTHLENWDNGVSDCSPDTLKWYVVNE